VGQSHEELKAEFISVRGYWTSAWDRILTSCPDYFAAYLELSSAPWRTGTLEPRVKEFIYIALDASTTHLYRPGLRIHIANALAQGATEQEVVDVLRVTSTLGLQAYDLGMRVLADETRNTGALGNVRNQSTFAEVNANFAAAAFTENTIGPKVRELILLAANIAVTHLNADASRRHVRSALAQGATPEEIEEVFQLASVLGIHTMAEGMPLLAELSQSEATTGPSEVG
jgi:alkylhydroperoxidase/carboxymuconolactone decarboxylase family protein YurZ